MPDLFESNVLSLALAWIAAILTAVGPIAAAVVMPLILTREEHFSPPLPWPFALWAAVCLLIISPLRYLAFQWMLIACYAVQSLWAAFSACLFVLFIGPIFFIVVWGIVLGVPIGITAIVLGDLGRPRLALVSLAFPVLCAGGYALFFLTLPYTAWAARWWLPAADALRATNGPAEYFYQFLIEPDIPRNGPTLRGPQGTTVRERLRAHVLNTYVSRKRSTPVHFIQSIRYAQAANDIMRERAFDRLADSEFEQVVDLFEAALRQAEQVDLAVLEARTSGMSAVYRAKFVAGLRLVIQGSEERSTVKSVRGTALLNEWGDWSNAHLGQIRDGR